MVDEEDMISILQSLIHELEMSGFQTKSTMQFFDVGEWLICFEGIENIYAENNLKEDEKFSMLKHYFY